MGNKTTKGDSIWTATSPPPASQQNPDWMGKLPDSHLLSELSIPGNHNTMTYQVDVEFSKLWVQCQSLSELDQLKLGIRFFDLRCQYYFGQLRHFHGKFFLKFCFLV